MLQPMQPFTFQVEDIFTITGRGTVFTGRVETGTAQVGQRINLNISGETFPAVITGIERFRKRSSTAGAGDSVGILVKQLDRIALSRIHGDDARHGTPSDSRDVTITSA
ncbi:EF-Tu/IF-2/RF-3 family GTPase [Populibacterium corticicola]|uniref:EF-Tu/IF-2/RF-3 family GTPase n=1 Tax=Populibacterium corticicola TaxID=1812826 RepID=A0ABW5XCT0_9MICO